MKIHHFDPPIAVKTPLGDAKVYLYIDRGRDEHGEWVCFLARDGTSWTFIDPDIRLAPCPTDGRFEVAKFGNQEKWDALYARLFDSGQPCEARPFKLASVNRGDTT